MILCIQLLHTFSCFNSKPSKSLEIERDPVQNRKWRLLNYIAPYRALDGLLCCMPLKQTRNEAFPPNYLNSLFTLALWMQLIGIANLLMKLKVKLLCSLPFVTESFLKVNNCKLSVLRWYCVCLAIHLQLPQYIQKINIHWMF